MGRGVAPPPPALPPLEEPRQWMPKTVPETGELQADRRLKRPAARYFPAEEGSAVTYLSRPAVPKPAVTRPLNASLKGFGWRVSEERIRPSADIADKVYYAPVVPGIPTQRKRPRRPKVLEPLMVPPMVSIAKLRNKVMGALDSALRSERLPQDMRYRLLGTVEQVMDDEIEEVPSPSPRAEAIQVVQEKVQKIRLAPTVSEPKSEAPTQTPRNEEAAASTRPPSSVQVPLEDETAEVPDVINEDEVMLVDGMFSDDDLGVFELLTDEVMENVFSRAEGSDEQR